MTARDSMFSRGAGFVASALCAALVLAGCSSGTSASPATTSVAISSASPVETVASSAASASSIESVESPASPGSSSSATVSATVSAEKLAEGEVDAPVQVAVDGGAAGVDVTFRKITLPPGTGTGVHCHYGQLIAVVAAGEFTHYAPIYPTGVHVYHAGEAVIEGPGYKHEGRNEGTQDVVLYVTYVTPEGDPLAETDLSKCDA